MKKPGLKASRRTLQVLTVVAFIIIPILNRSRYSLVYGNFLSFHAFGVPLADPLAVLQLTIKNFYLTLDNLIGVAIPMVIAFLAGTVFCSWVCPYGFFFLAGLLFLEFVAGHRFWCKCICPQSVLLVLVKQLNRKRLRVDFARDKCICPTGYERCEKACSLRLRPREVGKAREFDCSNCGACVVACSRMGKALQFRRGKGGE